MVDSMLRISVKLVDPATGSQTWNRTFLQLVAGVDMPAVGFGMGDVVLAELLREKEMLPELGGTIDCFIAYLGDEARRRALRVAQELRAAGLSVVYDFRERRLSNQLRAADQVGARTAVIIGPQEIEQSVVRVRSMTSGEERSVASDRLVEDIKRDRRA